LIFQSYEVSLSTTHLSYELPAPARLSARRGKESGTGRLLSNLQNRHSSEIQLNINDCACLGPNLTETYK
jgi:hypothetical protein